MKRFSLMMLVCVAMAAMLCSCASTPRTFEDLSEIPGVNNVYLGPGMMSMASSVANMAGGKVGNLSKNVTSFRLITADNTKAVKRIRPFMKKQIKHLGVTPMFNTNMGNGEQFSIYTRQSPSNPDQYTDLVMITDITDNMTVLILKGNFTAAQVKELRE